MNRTWWKLALCAILMGILAVGAFAEPAMTDETSRTEDEQAVAQALAEELYAKAAAHEPAVTADLQSIDGAIADYTTCIDHGYELAQTYYERAQLYAAKGDSEHQNSDLQNSLKYAG